MAPASSFHLRLVVGVCTCHTLTALQRPLLQSHLQRLSEDRYVVVKNWLDDTQIDELQRDAIAVDLFGGSHEAAIGPTASLDRGIRNSRVIPLYPPPSNSAGCEATRAALTRAVNELRGQLQESSKLRLPHMEPFKTQLSYLLYPRGECLRERLARAARAVVA